MQCPECNGDPVFANRPNSEIVCGKCGLVIGQVRTVQDFKHWAPRWYSNWNKSDSETMREWLTVLRLVSCQLNLPNFPYREEAARIIRQKGDVLFRRQTFGKKKLEAITALIHLVLQEYNKIRSIKEICRKLSLNPRLVQKCEWTMRKIVYSDRMPATSENGRNCAKDYLMKYGQNLISNLDVIKSTRKLLTSIQKYIGGNPISLSAGALYHICKHRKMDISKEAIGEAFHISARTVYTNELKIRRFTSGSFKV